MQRQDLLLRLDNGTSPWDVLVIGGGAVGLGAAMDAASRGYSTVVVEQHDFCKGTSSRSTKLIHGGVRYLAQGHVSLVRESLHERGRLLDNASSLVTPLRFVIPCFGARERWYYWTGMKCYDALAGRLGIQPSHTLNNEEIRAAVPALRSSGLRGGVGYYDSQFDDAGLGIAIARKIVNLGSVALNYCRTESLLIGQGRIQGVRIVDEETERHREIRARVVINATGAFSDEIRRMEDPSSPTMIAPSQGIHLVVEHRFLGGQDAIMIPKTNDGRVLFAIPWLGRVLLGTTDTPVKTPTLEPSAFDEEIDYLIDHFRPYLDPAPTRADVLSVFAGLRPLVKPAESLGATSKISREHKIVISQGGLVSILGGKWTTFRKMSESVIDEAAKAGSLPRKPSRTKELRLQRCRPTRQQPFAAPTVEEIEIAVREEFARTTEDVLARRLRLLLLDAKRSTGYARDVATMLAKELGRPAHWIETQVKDYRELASRYSINGIN